jgi:hypothetical protein
MLMNVYVGGFPHKYNPLEFVNAPIEALGQIIVGVSKVVDAYNRCVCTGYPQHHHYQIDDSGRCAVVQKHKDLFYHTSYVIPPPLN